MRNEITVSGDIFTDKQIVSGNVFMVQSLDGNELQYDKLDATLDLCSIVPTLFRPKNADGMLTAENELFGVRPRISILVADPASYKTGAVVLYKHNGSLVGKYYMDSIVRVAKTQYKINCVSPVGVLAKSQHYGGIYSGILFPALIAEIIGNVVPFTVAPEFENQEVYGWLPVASRRDNLHQALFAMGAAAQKDGNGDLYIAPLYDDVHMALPGERVYTGGSVRYPNASARVAVVEHAYLATDLDETVTLFDGLVASEQIIAPSGTSLTGALVLFNEPMHDLAVDNGTILESGVNYAVLSPAGNCKLTGKKYTHTTREIVRPDTATGSNSDDTYTVAEATLVSVVNSENVAARMAEYYGSAKTVSTGIVVESERAGSVVQFEDPFGDLTQGIITSMDIIMSNKLKASAEIVADYSPGNAGNFYTNFAVVTESGSWTVPDGVTKVRVILIGGGHGGESGKAGLDGTGSREGYENSIGQGGAGGEAGAGGAPGKIYVSTVSVSAGQSFSVVIGEGGAGAAYGGTPSEGGITTFGDFSSSDGYTPESGYIDPASNKVYALRGENGVAGGSGQDGASKEKSTVTYDGKTWYSGATGIISDTLLGVATGGGGGGAAVGFNGEDGAEGYTEYWYWGTRGKGGEGGDGATPVPGMDGATPGSGGQGGHGGGGGGGGGGVYDNEEDSYEISVLASKGGAGGSGSAGGSGAPGAVLIYY